jgi:hypothetical protein
MILLQGHAALRAIAGLVAHHALAHWAEVFRVLRGPNVAIVMMVMTVMIARLRRVMVFHGCGSAEMFLVSWAANWSALKFTK